MKVYLQNFIWNLKRVVKDRREEIIKWTVIIILAALALWAIWTGAGLLTEDTAIAE